MTALFDDVTVLSDDCFILDINIVEVFILSLLL
jgi:hypothetical protein